MVTSQLHDMIFAVIFRVNKTTIEKQLYQLTETKTENWPDQKITDLRTGINNTKNVDIDNEHETKMTLGN